MSGGVRAPISARGIALVCELLAHERVGAGLRVGQHSEAPLLLLDAGVALPDGNDPARIVAGVDMGAKLAPVSPPPTAQRHADMVVR